MPDRAPTDALGRCLELAALLRGLGREERAGAIAELERILRSMQPDRQRPDLPDVSETFPRRPSEQPEITMDSAGYITGWNAGAQQMFGYSPDEVIGQHILFLYTDDAGAHDTEVPELFLEYGSPTIEVRRRKKSGEAFRATLSLDRISGTDGESTGMVARLNEVVDRLTPDEKLRLHARIIEDAEEGILITDASERIVSVNSAFSRITGFSAAEAIGATPDILRSGVHSTDFRAEVRAALHGAGAWQGEIIGKRKNGQLFPQSVSIGVVRDANGKVSHAFSIFSDVSVLRAAEERMQQIVNYDSLTGLPNRTLFNRLVDQSLSAARRNDRYGAILVINLKRFSQINDSFGHEIGDELLRHAGQRFRQTLRDEDIVARIGADEFVVALVSIQKREHSGIVAEKLLAALEDPFVIQSQALHVGARIGIAIFPEDASETSTLLHCADAAMKRVDSGGNSGYLFFGPEMNLRAKEKWQLEGDLRRALFTPELLLHYQPKISLRNGRIVGAEALTRWQHPEQGMIPPGRFFPLAEETGLIYDLGNWILEEACRQIRAWLDAGLPLVPIAINLSARQFDKQLPARLSAAVDRHGIRSDLLKLEITESLLVRGQDDVIPIMNQLVALGFALSLDDFGTGYSSLAYLKKFPITTLKVDRSFVIGVPDDENDCAIARAIVTMGKQLRQEIVCEGVETLAQMNFLRDLGCDQLQGYLFSPPVPASSFAAMLHEGRRLALP